MADRMPFPALFGGQPLPPDTPITPGGPPGAPDDPIPTTPEQMQQDPMAQLIFLLLQDPHLGPLILEQLEALMASEEGAPPPVPNAPAQGVPPRPPMPPMPPMMGPPPTTPPAPGGPRPFTQALLNRR